MTQHNTPVDIDYARALRAMSPHDEALVLFENAVRIRSHVLGADEAGAASMQAVLLAAARSAFGVLPDLRDECLVDEAAAPDFITQLAEALEHLPDDLRDQLRGHHRCLNISVDDASRVTAALRGSFYGYADRAEITDPI